MGFRENVEALLLRSHRSQRELAAAGISSGIASPIPRNSKLTMLATVIGTAPADGKRREASGDELELTLHYREDLSSWDVRAVHVFLASFHKLSPRGTGMTDEMVLIPRRLRSLRFNA